MTYDGIYLREACKVAAAESQDSRTQNGAILRTKAGHVVSAANKFPPIALTDERRHNDTKYSYIEHAERHVIYLAARYGLATNDSTLYCPWFACADCARAIILAGVSRVVGLAKLRQLTPARWQASIDIADAMFGEAGVKLQLLDEQINATLLFNGELLTL